MFNNNSWAAENVYCDGYSEFLSRFFHRFKVELFFFYFSGWLEDYESEIIERLSRQLEAITGLSTARVHSEALQVNTPHCNKIRYQAPLISHQRNCQGKWSLMGGGHL